ncbi:glycosyltransferase family 2 protein [Methylomicrobium sp. RS1]|jgi:glycosyltransferase involved in cell wall biosynthesis|uniref:glycosyltransferase family 2 protein n=1 Tax=Candidatus Methylomicrobium oryzae TaxID=2802053 RepID=UPI001921FF24|nr:glycosyltransferase family 2 protein [Methylomicrobium sp. RS1]MBL1265037.1 glycosyltransferase family 2 protein [Methylomicrobium sp. RS1]
MTLISVIVTTYNWPEALLLCLDSLFVQTDRDFEIVIADDGSRPENHEKAQSFCKDAPVPVAYVHHEDQGFRAGTIRNKAVAKSCGDYLLFVDGDCVLMPDFVARHRRLAEAGYFVPGNRILLSRGFTNEVLAERLPIYLRRWPYFWWLRLLGRINRISALLQLPLGGLRYFQPRKWDKAMTCNLGVWKSDFVAVNGFDELFEGWGYEDSDLVIRLIHAGVRRKEGRFAVPVLHLWHPSNDKSRQGLNYQRLMERLAREDFKLAERGVAQYLPESVQTTQ